MNVRLESGAQIAGDALHAIRRNFDLMDADEDGRLSRDEARPLFFFARQLWRKKLSSERC